MVFSIIGSIGSPYIVREHDYFGISSSVAILRPNSKKINSKFLYYWMTSDVFQKYVENIKSGAAQGFLSLGMINKLPVLLPDMSTQVNIARSLSTYDELIENNNSRIGLLEKATQDLYKEWFVRFRFPGYKETKFINGIPYRWSVEKFGDKVEIIDGDRGKNYPTQGEFSNNGYCLFLNTGNVTQIGFNFSTNSFISEEKDNKLRKGKLQYGDVVMTTRGTVGNVALYNDFVKYENMRINSGMVIIREKIEGIPTEFIYALLKSDSMKNSIVSYSSGSAQPQLPIKDMRKIKFILPTNDLINRFVEKSNKVNLMISNLQTQNINLK